MAKPTTAQINELFRQMADAWSKGNGSDFGAVFSQSAHFVAFDGTVLQGPDEISQYHQAAFDNYLQGTELVISVQGTQDIGETAVLVFTQGSIQRKSGASVGLVGHSIGITVAILENERLVAQAFQNTRHRPISGERSANAWKQFDAAWNESRT